MRTRIAKWGHSLAVRIRKAFADDIRLTEGAEVELTVADRRLVIAPVDREYDLERLVAGITPENRHPETDWGAPAGSATW